MIRAHLLIRSVSYSFSHSPTTTIASLLVVFIAPFVVGLLQTNYLVAQGFTPTFGDSLFWLLSPHKFIPLLWCITPAVFMLWLMLTAIPRSSVNWIIRQGHARHLWLEDFLDVLTGSVLFTIIMMVGVCVASLFFSHGTINFGPHSLFQALTDKTLENPPSLTLIIMIASALSYLVLAVFGCAFQLGRLACRRPLLPFIVLVLLGLPLIHGTQTFALEFAHLFNLSIDTNAISNPLAIPFQVSSVFYDSWVPGAGHGLWLQAVFIIVLFFVGLLLEPHKDQLQR